MKYSTQYSWAKVAQLLSIITISIVMGSLSATDTSMPFNIQTTIDSLGNQVSVWQVDTAGSSSIQSSYFLGTSWSAPVTISGSDPGHHPTLVGNSEGDVIAAWFRYDSVNGVDTLAVARFAVNSGWASPLVLTTGTDITALFKFDLKINASGTATLTWSDYNFNTTLNELWTSYASLSGSWSTPTQLH